MTSRPPPKKRVWSWRSQAFRGVVYQVLALALIALAAGYLLSNTLANMRARGIQSGFDFVWEPAGFAIGESLIPFDSAESYLKAYAVGLVNTLRVAVAGIVLATVLGTLVGIGRLSRNLLVRSICGAYVEVTRNIPLLLQLFMWYFALTELLPPVEEAMHASPGFFFSKNGLQFPLPHWEPGHWGTLVGLAAGLVLAWGWGRLANRRFETTGQALPTWLPGLVLAVIGAALGWLAGGAPSAWELPEKTEINVIGGGSVTPEYLTVLVGLTVYTAGYIAEVVRAGIQSVPFGQHEAAAALGLTRTQELRLVQLPQALRVIIPPLTSQYLNLTKNSSLAVAVGYPDLVSISATALNQTGRAIECIALVMACYLTLSLLTSAAMNLYNRRARLKDR
ncbi:MAG: ABC transporter permease subunit [Betaproteobacteria bacterium]|nr:ABC transporter permease subunit [Betaproteobacteria bacterium]MCC6249319.1 ABC transporter permease subunit [Rubrivivax sp.]